MTRYEDLTVPPAETLPPMPETVASLPNNTFVLTSHGVAGSRNYGGNVDGRYQAVAERLFDGQGAGVLSQALGNRAIAADASDYATGHIQEYLASLNADAVAGQPLEARMVSNPNKDRETEITTAAERATFGGMPVWDEQPAPQVHEQVIAESWDTFHDRVQAGIETVALHTPANEHMLIVDIHDTDIKEFKPDGSIDTNEPVDDYFAFPLLLVSNREGAAAHPHVLNTLGSSLFRHLLAAGLIDAEQAAQLGFKENEPYKGAYTTERYGVDLENAYLLRGNDELQTKAQHMHTVQVELNRAMYVLKDRSGIDVERMVRTQQAVANALAETADYIREMDHDPELVHDLAAAGLPPIDAWRTAPAAGTAEYDTAMNMRLIAAHEWYQQATPVTD